tara:strand:- start:3 stop:260 length:258 start_codon:yes stop_codon:yes gene_type:complete
MALSYKIAVFETDSDDATKTKVGFSITDSETGNQLEVDGLATTGSNTDAEIIAAAQANCQSTIDSWVASTNNIGKTWNPDSNTLE